MKIEISKLNPHPYNHRIYGYDDNLDELVEKIKTSNWIKPILINKNNMIISGHRRVDVCKKLDITEIEYELVDDDPIKQLELFVSENFYRIKTTSQLLKESEIYFDIEKKKSYIRQTEIGKQNLGQSPDEDKWTQLGETGRTTQIVSNKIGMSESTYKRGRKVMDYIKDYPEYEWFFENTMDKSVDKSLQMTEKSPEFIDKVIELVNGDKTKIIPVIKKLEKEEMTSKTPLPPGKYDVIISDLTRIDYDELLKIDISSTFEDHCHLYFWVTPNQIESGIEVMRKWGFTYHTCLVWSRYLKEVTSFVELVLVGYKGNPPTFFKFHEGSFDKPELFEKIMRRCYPNKSKVEILIGDGWKMW